MGIVLPITLVTAGAAALINAWLVFRVGQVRRASGISIGDGGDQRLIARMRAQANFVENAPFILILIGLIELGQGPSLWLWVASIAFLLARIVHPLGMDGMRWGRMAGTIVTLLLLIGLGLYAVLTPWLQDAAAAPTHIVGPTRG